MANPFGSNDEALSVNDQNQYSQNLVYAVIPRSASKVVEVINGGSITNLTGAYNADGYWHPNTTTRTDVVFTIASPWAVGTNHTVITGWYRDMGAGSPTFAATSGAYRDAQAAYTISTVNTDGISITVGVRDNAYQLGPTGNMDNQGNTVFAVAHKNSTSGPVQSGYRRVGSTNTTFTSTALTMGTGTSDQVNRVGVKTASRFPFQYLFIYDTALPDADINAIIDAPGSIILSYGGNSPRAMNLMNRRRHQ
jgi:hypothetical protein